MGGKKQTAVEWLAEQINLGLSEKGLVSVINKAKQMEKEIICTAYLDGIDDEYTTSEQYYNETYKNTEE